MRNAYRITGYVIMLGVLVQAASVAGGWFGAINDVDGGAVITEDYEGNIGHTLHGIVGMMVMPLLGLVLFILSFLAKVPGGVKWAGLTLLAIIVQVVIGIIAFSVPVIGALHGINAFVIFGLAMFAARAATALPADHVHTGASATV